MEEYLGICEFAAQYCFKCSLKDKSITDFSCFCSKRIVIYSDFWISLEIGFDCRLQPTNQIESVKRTLDN